MYFETSSRVQSFKSEHAVGVRPDVVPSRHVEAMVDSVRSSVVQLIKSNDIKDNRSRENSESDGPENGTFKDSTEKHNGFQREVGSNTSASTHDQRYDWHHTDGVVDIKGINATGLSASVQHTIIPPQLETLVQMLMMLFGSAHISAQDKKKILSFIQEIMSLSEKSTVAGLKDSLFALLNRGVDRLRTNGEIMADDLAEIENVVERKN